MNMNLSDTRVIYHGSSVSVMKPEIRTNGFAKDFGFGFYCTELERQVKRWALSKRPTHIVSVYGCRSLDGLNVRQFSEMSEAWLDFVVDCRRGRSHAFDVVEGPMADDTIWNYVEDFAAGQISREAFWALVKFRHPTHQIAFCTAAALARLEFRGSYACEE